MHVPCTCHAHPTQSCGALRPPASARPRRAWRAWPRPLSLPCRARARAPVAGSAAAHVACRPARRTRRGLESPPEAAAGGWGRTAASRPARARTGLHPRRLLVHVRMCACGAYRGCVRPRCSACSSLVSCRWGGYYTAPTEACAASAYSLTCTCTVCGPIPGSEPTSRGREWSSTPSGATWSGLGVGSGRG